MSCQHRDTNKTFRIYGSIKGDVPVKIFLEYDNQVDSSLVKDKKFYFSGKASNFTEAKIRTSGVSAFADNWIYLENKEIDLTLKIERKKSNKVEFNWISIDTITGTETAKIRNDFEQFERSILSKNNKSELLYEKIEHVITGHPQNNYSSYLLSKYAKLFSSEQVKYLLDKIDTTSIAANRLEALKSIISPDRILQVGSKIANFSLSDVNGKTINTIDLKNKTILIDFWASWCGPCRKKYPELKKIYHKYRNNDFEVLGVSIDTNKEQWKQAINKDGLPWIHLIENERFSGKVASRYNVQALPTNYLINKEGIIIAKNISLERLQEHLAN